MNKRTLALSFLFSTLLTANGQSKSTDFELSAPGEKISKSLYRTIRALDSRQDTSNLGISRNDKSWTALRKAI